MSERRPGGAVVPPNPINTEVPLALPLGFIVGGIFSFAGLAVGSLLFLPDVAFLRHNTRLLTLVHLFTLGWGSAVTLGVLHQMAPVILATPLFSIKLGWFSLGTFVPGSLLLAFSFSGFWIPGIATGGILAILGASAAVWNLRCTLRASPEVDVARRALAPALAAFISVLLLGFSLAVMLRMRTPAGLSTQLLAVHIFLGGAGWFTGIIMGVSYRLVPMFILSHAHDQKLAHGLLVALYTGVLLGIAGGLSSSGALLFLGALLIFLAALAYAYDMSRLWRLRVRQPDLWMRQVPIAIAYLVVATGGTVVAFLLSIGGRDVSDRVILGLGVLFALGFVSSMILTLLHKVLPFLIWFHRWSPRVGKESVPLMKDLVSPAWGRIGFIGYHGGVVLTALGVATGVRSLAAGGTGILALGALLLLGDLTLLLIPQEYKTRLTSLWESGARAE